MRARVLALAGIACTAACTEQERFDGPQRIVYTRGIGSNDETPARLFVMRDGNAWLVIGTDHPDKNWEVWRRRPSDADWWRTTEGPLEMPK